LAIDRSIGGFIFGTEFTSKIESTNECHRPLLHPFDFSCDPTDLNKAKCRSRVHGQQNAAA
jgi:hypothetical protein